MPAFANTSFLNGEIMDAEDFDSSRDTGRIRLDGNWWYFSVFLESFKLYIQKIIS